MTTWLETCRVPAPCSSCICSSEHSHYNGHDPGQVRLADQRRRLRLFRQSRSCDGDDQIICTRKRSVARRQSAVFMLRWWVVPICGASLETSQRFVWVRNLRPGGYPISVFWSASCGRYVAGVREMTDRLTAQVACSASPHFVASAQTVVGQVADYSQFCVVFVFCLRLCAVGTVVAVGKATLLRSWGATDRARGSDEWSEGRVTGAERHRTVYLRTTSVWRPRQ